MAFRHKRNGARSGPKGFWRKQSMAERRNSVRSRTCGQDGVAGDVITISRRRCTGSTRRRSQQSQELGLLPRRARVGRKREKLEAWKPRIKSLEHELMLWERRKEHKWGQVSPLQKKGTRKKCGETVWKSRMTPNVAKKWMNRGKRCRGSYERSKDCPLLQRKCKRTSWSQCNISCKKCRKKSNDLMPEHQRVQKMSQKIQSIQDKRKHMQKESLAA